MNKSQIHNFFTLTNDLKGFIVTDHNVKGQLTEIKISDGDQVYILEVPNDIANFWLRYFTMVTDSDKSFFENLKAWISGGGLL